MSRTQAVKTGAALVGIMAAWLYTVLPVVEFLARWSR